jgi:hypothetical protein
VLTAEPHLGALELMLTRAIPRRAPLEPRDCG